MQSNYNYSLSAPVPSVHARKLLFFEGLLFLELLFASMSLSEQLSLIITLSL